jgi:hypothetical protein
MARRADPERIYQAGRAAIRNRLIGTGLDEATGDAWIGACAEQAVRVRIERNAETGWEWITGQREHRRRPGS